MDALQVHAAARCLQRDLADAALRRIWECPGGLVLETGRGTVSVCALATAPGLWWGGTGETPSHPFAKQFALQARGYHIREIGTPWRDRIIRLGLVRRHLSKREESLTLVAELFGPRGNMLLLDEEDRTRTAWRWDVLDGPDPRILPRAPYRPPLREDTPLWFMAPKLRPEDNGDTWGLAGAGEEATSRCPTWHMLEKNGRSLAYPIALPGWRDLGPLDWRDAIARPAGPSVAGQDLAALAGRLEGRLRRTLDKVDGDLAHLQDPAECRRFAHALYAQPDAIPAEAQVVAMDYASDPPKPLTIPITPGRSLYRQAEGYFQLARKAERGRGLAMERRERIGADIALLLEERARWQGGKIGDEQFASRLHAFETPFPAARRPDRQTPALHRTVVEGYDILWGGNARQNAYLSFQAARPWDLWFHVQGHPGAHVLVRVPRRGQAVPETVLDAAATLALRHSRCQGQGGEVDWTEARNVRRRPGGKPGEVLYHPFRTRRAGRDRKGGDERP